MKMLACCQHVAGAVRSVDSLESCLRNSEDCSNAFLDALRATEDFVNAAESCFDGTCACSDICDQLLVRMYVLANHKNIPPVFGSVLVNYFEGGEHDDRGETR